AHDPGLRATRYGTGGRGGRVQVTQRDGLGGGGGPGPEDGELGAEAVDGPPDQRDPRDLAGVGDEVPGGEVVASVQHEVVSVEYAGHVERRQADPERLDLHPRGELGQPVARRLHLGTADGAHRVDDLPVQIAGVHVVVVDHRDPTDAR